MSNEEIQKTALAAAAACLEGKAPVEKAAIIHQHIGRREMTDMIIETLEPNSGTLELLLWISMPSSYAGYALQEVGWEEISKANSFCDANCFCTVVGLL